MLWGCKRLCRGRGVAMGCKSRGVAAVSRSWGFAVNYSGLSPLMDQLTLCPSSPVVCTPPWECSTPTDRVPLDKKGAAVTLELDIPSTWVEAAEYDTGVMTG